MILLKNTYLKIYFRLLALVSALPVVCLSQTIAPVKKAIKADSAIKVSWLKQNAISIRTIDPSDENFSDLEELMKIIGDARVVMIGEPNHHVAPIYLGKTRLIKFLHQKMGFNMLAFECGMYDVAKAWQDIKSGKDSRKSFRDAIFFGGREEYKPLISYLEKSAGTSAPLELTGFDSQMNGRYSKDSLFIDLRRFLKNLNLKDSNLNEGSFFIKELLKANAYNGYNVPDKKIIPVLDKLLSAIDSLTTQPVNFEAAFFIQVLKSIKREAQRKQLNEPANFLSGNDNERLFILNSSIRDEQMADNLLWYFKQFPQKKIIVIAHNVHLMLDYPDDWAKEPWNFVSGAPRASFPIWDNNYMGYVLKDSLKNKVFNIAITGNKGELGWINHIDSAKSFRLSMEKNESTGTLENYLDAAGFHYAIVNLKNPSKGGQWLKGKFKCRYFGGPGSETEWHKAADAIFYIRDFSPTNIKD